MVYLCIVLVPAFLGAAWQMPDLRGVLVSAAMIIAAAAIGAFFYLMVKRPHMLQSEDYQLRHESLEIMREKAGKVVVDAAGIERIATSKSGGIIEGGGRE